MSKAAMAGMHALAALAFFPWNLEKRVMPPRLNERPPAPCLALRGSSHSRHAALSSRPKHHALVHLSGHLQSPLLFHHVV